MKKNDDTKIWTLLQVFIFSAANNPLASESQCRRRRSTMSDMRTMFLSGISKRVEQSGECAKSSPPQKKNNERLRHWCVTQLMLRVLHRVPATFMVWGTRGEAIFGKWWRQQRPCCAKGFNTFCPVSQLFGGFFKMSRDAVRQYLILMWFHVLQEYKDIRNAFKMCLRN